MKIEYTDEEKKALAALENKYKKKLEEVEADIERLKDVESIEGILKTAELRQKWIDLIETRNRALNRFMKKAEKGRTGNETQEPDTLPDLVSFVTRSPKQWLTPVDKVSNSTFAGKIKENTLTGVEVTPRNSNKPIYTMVSLDFQDPNITITGKKALTAYDREVHDAVVTLFIEGGNEYITPRMIYRAMTGNPQAPLNPKQQATISESLNKIFYSRLTIDASLEAEAYGFKSFKYQGYLIAGEKVTATTKGGVVEEVYRILQKPALYSYASIKNQIGRFDIKLLNSPVNKNEEMIELQSYLYRRILSMQNGKLSSNILYETIYEHLGTEAATPGALRKKKTKIRDQAKVILDYWIEQKFISGYVENKKGTTIISLTINF